MAIQKFTEAALADLALTDAVIADNSIDIEKLSNVNLNIAPEVLEIQVSAPQAGQDTQWLWTWLTSSLPYARRTITNSPEISVPLYRQGTYTVNNYAAYDIFDDMTQTHSLYLKWIDGAGTDNLIDWAVSTGPVSDSHPDINGGNATDVQRINISVPATITLPTLTAPSVSYTVTNNGAGAYTFSGAAKGDNPNLGPFYRGGTYTININAVGHPFYFTTDNGTNFVSGTYFGEYTSGVTGSRTDNGTITFTVPNDAPDTLYYQCGNHGVMRGAITVKDLAVETNINGNPVVYFQHTQEGHKTPVELRPIPSLVNQMCLVYDAASGQFVPQDLATYVENTPSFENKIREVAGTAELVVEDGSAVIAKVNVYDDSTYLPLVGNNPGDQAFATDTDILYIWDGSAWQQAGAANTDDLAEGTTNLFYTDARVGTYLSAQGYDTATNIIATITDSAPTTLDTLNELAAALGDDPNFATTVTNSIATKAPLVDPVFTGQLTASGPLDANLVTQSTDGTTGVKFIDSDGTGHLYYVGASDHFYTTSRLSVGTAANNTSLDVYHAVNNTVAWLESGDAGVNITFKDSDTTNRPYIGATGNNIILGHVSGGDKVTIDSDGNVGIGTDNPDTTLVVDSSNVGPLRIRSSNNNGAYIRLSDPTTSADPNHVWIGSKGNDTRFYQSNSLLSMVIRSDGHVGIGTSNPGSFVELENNNYYLALNRTDDSGYHGIQLQSTGSAKGYLGLGGTGGHFTANGQQFDLVLRSENDLRLVAGGGSASEEEVHIRAGSGNVGLGVNNPNSKLAIDTPAAVGLTNLDSNNGLYSFASIIETPRTSHKECVFLMNPTANGQKYIHLVTNRGGAIAWDLDIVSGRSGSERAFGRVTMSGYKYHESDGDFRHGAHSHITSINAYGNYFEVNGEPTHYLAINPTDTSQTWAGGGTNADYWVVRIPILMNAAGTGTTEFTAILKATYHNQGVGGSYWIGFV